MKYFLGMLRHQWILSIDWVVECLTQRKHVPEKDFVVKGDPKIALPQLRQGGPNRARFTVYTHSEPIVHPARLLLLLLLPLSPVRPPPCWLPPSLP